MVCLCLLAACRPAAVRPGNPPTPPKAAPPAEVQTPPVRADTVDRGGGSRGRTFTLTNPATRDSLRAIIARERNAWQATGVRNYQVLVRVQCFCPGSQEWLRIQVRNGRTESVRSSTGTSMPITERNDYSVDRLFDILDREAMRDDVVEVGFDPVSHFPTYIRTDIQLGRPDDWGIFEIRGFQVL